MKFLALIVFRWCFMGSGFYELSLMRMNGTLNIHCIQVMLTEVKHQGFLEGRPSWHYSNMSTLNYDISSLVKPTLFAISFAKSSTSVVPYEPFMKMPLKLINWYVGDIFTSNHIVICKYSYCNFGRVSNPLT